ncbi:MAG: hypothetical protein M5R36_29870 [Deltaproteobacteria bacterium]|nr:hypothetical protein [Deltaproteobacteria bacterium]
MPKKVLLAFIPVALLIGVNWFFRTPPSPVDGLVRPAIDPAVFQGAGAATATGRLGRSPLAQTDDAEEPADEKTEGFLSKLGRPDDSEKKSAPSIERKSNRVDPNRRLRSNRNRVTPKSREDFLAKRRAERDARRQGIAPARAVGARATGLQKKLPRIDGAAGDEGLVDAPPAPPLPDDLLDEELGLEEEGDEAPPEDLDGEGDEDLYID